MKRYNTAKQYVNRIKNSEKKRYAATYHAHKIWGKRDPDELIWNLSTMGKQAVRMRIDEIYGY